MKKTIIFIIVALLILISVIPLIYAIFPESQPAIGDFFGGLSQSAMVLFTGFSEQFMQLPYWVAIFGGLAFLFGIFFDRQAWKLVLGMRKRLVGDAVQSSGLYQKAPAYQQSPAPQPQQAPPQPFPPKQEIEAK